MGCFALFQQIHGVMPFNREDFKMLKLNYETASDIPEALKEHYTEKDGVYVLQAEGLKTDKDVAAVKEALDKERKLRRDAEAKAKDFESKYSLLPEDFDIEEFNRLKDTSQGDVDSKLKEQRERITSQHQKELEKLKAQLSEKDELVTKHVKEATLQRAMTEANVSKPFVPAVMAMMRDRIKVEGGEVYLDEKPVNDALKEWANSDEGKHYVAAAQNSGGGSNTAKGGDAKAKQIARSDFDAMSHAERHEAVKSGAKVVD